ncbi:hypothetical protein [Halolamina sp. C58]|uniref:hypothetical protein n=1 Tax=Halolamina sp. C58 TaxID=3421640 RepID=UPI003EB6BCE9
MTELLQNIEQSRIVDVAIESLEEAGIEVLDYEVTDSMDIAGHQRVFADMAVKTEDTIALDEIESVDDGVSVRISGCGGAGVYCGISVHIEA